MFIGYIYVLSHDGYVTQTKYMREIIALPIVGEPVKSFYDEISPFINFAAQFNEANEVLLIENDNLLAFTQQEMLLKTMTVAQDFMGLIKASACEDLLASPDEHWLSLYDEVIKSLVSIDKDFKITSCETFSQKEYQRLHNQLQVCSAGTQESVFFNKLLSGVNTILMMNHLIPQSSIIHLNTYQDEEEKTHLDYTKAASMLRDLEYTASHVKNRKIS